MTIGEATIAALIGVVGGILANDLFAWLPRLAQWILEKAVKRAPEEIQDRLRDEWKADMSVDMPGNLSKVIFAAHLLWKARSMEGGLMGNGLPEGWVRHGDAALMLAICTRDQFADYDQGMRKATRVWINASLWMLKRSFRRRGQGKYGALDRALLAANTYLLTWYTQRLQNRDPDRGRNP